LPERWLEGDASEGRKAWIPFTTGKLRRFFTLSASHRIPCYRIAQQEIGLIWIGAYACAGKSLAYLEMRMVAARVVMRFRCELTKEMEDAAAWERGIRDLFVSQNPRLWLKFQERL
jgi:cytochrome P450